MLVACGKTGALYLPEEAPEVSGTQPQNTAQQDTQSQDKEASSDRKAD